MIMFRLVLLDVLKWISKNRIEKKNNFINWLKDYFGKNKKQFWHFEMRQPNERGAKTTDYGRPVRKSPSLHG